MAACCRPSAVGSGAAVGVELRRGQNWKMVDEDCVFEGRLRDADLKFLMRSEVEWCGFVREAGSVEGRAARPFEVAFFT